jgi:hypothetical protein
VVGLYFGWVWYKILDLEGMGLRRVSLGLVGAGGL